MSFFVIIVVLPYLVALVAFVKPDFLQRFTREWPWEARRAEWEARGTDIVEPADGTPQP